jgi:5-methylcytosine-specific restriction protein A
MTLNKKEKEELENRSLQAFSGSREKLVNGVRIQTPRGQVAAIYWSALDPSNEVEIAVAQARITEKYPVPLIQSWIDWQKDLHPNPCAIHQHQSDWPIIGFTQPQALVFLKELYLLRQGFLNPEVLATLKARQLARSPEEARHAHLVSEMEGLRPTRQKAVIDLVKKAGIDIKPWYVRKDGTPAVTPRSNPAYCYNWAFGGGSEPTLVCVWHEGLEIKDNAIQMRANLRDHAARLEAISADISNPDVNRSRARQQAPRARQLDTLIAAASGRSIRAIVLEGNMRRESQLGEESSVVRVRHLDQVEWLIHQYDTDSGEFVIRRHDTGTQIGPLSQPIAHQEPERYADQHDLAAGTDEPEPRNANGNVYPRDPEVRSQVLERSGGHCELCNQPGFALPDGRLFVETHHVRPLSEGGVDRVWNVTALCPTHHREAHYGARKAAIRAILEEFMQAYVPIKAATSHVAS